MPSDTEKKRLGVLFVDDNQKILDLLKLDLKTVEDEYSFYFVLDPVHALERIKQGGIHIVFADFDMPQMNGLEWLKNVRIVDPMIVRLVITAFGDLGTTEKFVENAEVFGFIKKPWKREYLLGQLDQAKAFFFNSHPNYDGHPWSIVAAVFNKSGEIEIQCKYPGIAPFDSEIIAKKVFESFPDLFEDDFELKGYTLPLTYEKVTVRSYFDSHGDYTSGIFFIKDNIESWQVKIIDEVFVNYIDQLRSNTSDYIFLLHQMLDSVVELLSKNSND